jgi:hypothetical protein
MIRKKDIQVIEDKTSVMTDLVLQVTVQTMVMMMKMMMN